MARKKRNVALRKECSRGHLLKTSNLRRVGREQRIRRECASCSQARSFLRKNPHVKIPVGELADRFYEKVKDGPNVTIDDRSGVPVERPLFDDGRPLPGSPTHVDSTPLEADTEPLLFPMDMEPEEEPESTTEAPGGSLEGDLIEESRRKLELLRSAEGLISQEEIQLRTLALLDEVMGGGSDTK